MHNQVSLFKKKVDWPTHYRPGAMSSSHNTDAKKLCACWQHFSQSCGVTVAIASSIFVSTYCRRCSANPGQTTAGTLICRFMWLFILDHTFSIGLSMGEYDPRR